MMTTQGGRIITFYSYKGGTGRTMALANTAWILASSGKRVLTIDWDLEAPGLHRFFKPFLDPNALAATTGVIDIITEYSWAATTGGPRRGPWHLDFARVDEHAVSLMPERHGLSFPEGGTLDFLSAGRQNREYSATVTSFEWDNFYERLGGGLFLDALRDDMRANYDYVLIDSRTGLSDNADICTIQMPDVVVTCFTLSDQAMDGAAAVAASIEAKLTKRRIQLLPVPMRVDEGEKQKVDAGRALARLKFDGLPKGIGGQARTSEQLDAYWGAVEIPYRPYYAYEETLATVGDKSGKPNSLLSAFERLTAEISAGEVTHMPPIPEQARLRCLEVFTRRPPLVTQPEVLIVYAAENRLWAEWSESVCRRAGCNVTLHDVSSHPLVRPTAGARPVVLLSSAFLSARNAPATWHILMEHGEDQPHTPGVAFRIDDVRPTGIYSGSTADLHTLDETQSTAVLLGSLGVEVEASAGGVGPSFPARTPTVWAVPTRNTTFTGRALVLDQLRDQLQGGMSVVLPRPQALFGLGGVGKTQVALEYVHRFMADYDLVWWISAEHIENVIASLAELGAEIGATGGDDITLVSQEAVHMLARDVPTKRWLLVFDNADDPADLTRFLPRGGSGHILVTSRNQAWASQAESLPVAVFTREESIEHLSRRAPGLSAEEADRVAEAVGDLPLAVEQAAAWLAETATPVDGYLLLLAEQATNVLSLNRAADYPDTVAKTWLVSIARLRERSPASVRLLQVCAFMGPEPISSHLLYSKNMLDELRTVDPTLQETLLLGRVIREIARLALAQVDQAGSSIQIHRLVQAVIRSQLTEDEQQRARHVVHLVLAGARPQHDEPTDNPDSWPLFETIWPHLQVSGVRDCDEPEPRRLLIDRVRYLWKRGGFTAAAQLAQDLLEQWRCTLGEDDIQYLYLRAQLANVRRSQGRYVEAREIDEDVLDRQSRVLGPTHPHTYMTTSSLSGDLTALGEYRSAVERAREAYDGYGQIFHESHPRTLNAANNLALALRMVGRYGEARDIDQDTYDRRKEVLGPNHPNTLSSASSLGRDLREVGRYTDSVKLLEEAYASHKEYLGKTFPGTLSCAKALAVSLRRAGLFAEAVRLTTATQAEYRTQYEVPTPDSLACDLNWAADLYATGKREQARREAQVALTEYMKVPGEKHPYTLAALNNLAIYQWSCGSDEAEPAFLRACELMAEVLGERHPHTLFCRANRANVLADQGRLEEARQEEESAHGALKEILGARHPETLAVGNNLALTLRQLGQVAEAEHMSRDTLVALEQQAAALGSNNAILQLVSQRQRVYRDLEPLAV
ncbi:FxSxx-COOH system tetratricopeptide repeat protein [Streptomyces europaeiscabiei]|uniref:FxSxx-COOH system tetratricopeptide repeat protein n=1 Tax=Streptomyces europaeiscabiei TaxID=146819 RepID=UPI0038D39B60